jgi:type VI secretion system protein ImpC
MSPDRDRSFRILVLGDFSGRASRGLCTPEDLPRRRIHRVDRDEFDALFARLGVGIRLAAGPARPGEEIALGSPDDLHPDALFERLPLFGELRRLRRRLADPRTFAAAAAELGLGAAGPGRGEQSDPAIRGGDRGDDLLLAVLDATAGGPGDRASERGAELVDALLRELVIPNVSPAPDPRQPECVEGVDRTIAVEMRRLLRDPGLRGVEAAWRGLEFLVRRVETDASLSIDLLDLTRAELEADLGGARGLEGSALRARLVDASLHTPGGEPWALILGADTFDVTPGSAGLLRALAGLAAAAGAPFVAGGGGPGAATEDPAASSAPDAGREAWRRTPEAAFLALVVPRLLLRLPYGARGGSVERFAFEELESADDHEGYLWGSGAFAVGVALATRFAESGWAIDPRATWQLDGLPADVRERDGEMVLQPCAERLLTDRDAERIAASGATVLRSIRGRDAVLVGPLRGLGGQVLAGPWSRGR